GAPTGRRGEGDARRVARDRRVDGGVVSRAPPRAPARVAGRRHRPAQGRAAFLRRRGRACGARTLRAVREPLRALPARRSLRWRRRMTIRDATPADKELLLTLVDEFESELPPLPYADDTPEEDWERIEKRIHEGVVLIAEEEGDAVGFTEAEFAKGHVFVVDL